MLHSNHKFRIRPRTARPRTLGMARKFDLLPASQLHHLLEFATEAHENFFRLLFRPILSPGNITGNAPDLLTHRLGPETQTVEPFTNVDHHTHEFPIFFARLESFADGTKDQVQPELVDGGGFLVFELVCPFAAMFVLRVFPFRADTFLEEVIVGFESEFRDGCDVVL